MNEIGTNQLPKSWITLPLSEVIQTQKGRKPYDLGEKSENRKIPYINIKAFEKGIVTEYAPEQDAVYCTENDVLLVWDGARAGLSGKGISGYVGSTLTKITSDLVDTKLLSYYFESIYRMLNTQTKGVGIPHINPVILNNLPFNLPPKYEQLRVVDKIEELFSELDAGVKELESAQTKLGQYRQSLLKSAVVGSLTEQWRAENSTQVQETGEQLLTRILKQRREQWQQQKLAEFAEKSKTPPKNWQEAYPEPVQPDTTDLPELPEGWVWASVAQVASELPYSLAIGPFGSNLKVIDYRDEGVPLIFVRNIRSGNYGGEFTKFISEEKAIELAAHKAVGGDVIITKMGEPPGDADIYPLNQPDAIVTADCIKVSCDEKLIFPAFLKATINSLIGRQQIRPMTKGVAQKKISLGRFSFFAVPIPSLTEQKMIITKLSEDLELITRQLDSIHLGLKQSDAQRKNILNSAFFGQLVPQDLNDEPASVLLEKIQLEREAWLQKPKTNKIKTRSAMKKITVEELAKWVSDYKGNSFTFEKLQTAFQGDYDQLKDCVYEILGAKKPLFKQVFDTKLNTVKFIKEDK